MHSLFLDCRIEKGRKEFILFSAAWIVFFPPSRAYIRQHLVFWQIGEKKEENDVPLVIGHCKNPLTTTAISWGSFSFRLEWYRWAPGVTEDIKWRKNFHVGSLQTGERDIVDASGSFLTVWWVRKNGCSLHLGGGVVCSCFISSSFSWLMSGDCW